VVGREGRPFVILKAALSVDGGIAEAPGRRTALTSAEANHHAHAARAEVDAIGVGVGTILVDDPQLTARGVYRGRPLARVVFDRRLRTPPDARVLSTRGAGPVIIITTPAAAARPDLRAQLEARGAEIEVAGVNDAATIAQALAALGKRHIESLLLEGGALLHQAAWDAGVVDFVRLYMTPHVLGPGAVPFLGGRPFDSASLHRRAVVPLGPDVMVEGYVHGSR
jgi:diaminohydroxyphosphoribosylaminopyrimidine deaminase/5-amino-6-(5-phosphoribosylamino)uracil reductase